MKNCWFPLLFVTILLVLYNALPFWGVNENIIAALFPLSPIALSWMLIRILKDGQPADKKWDDYFYEDYPYQRNGKEDSGRDG